MEKAFWLTLSEEIIELRKTNPSLTEAAKTLFSLTLEVCWLILLFVGKIQRYFEQSSIIPPKNGGSCCGESII